MLWEIDPDHTLVEFSVRHLAINLVKGRFSEVQGTIYLDTNQPENSWVKAMVNAASIYTGNAQRDAHLRSADFFDVEQYPNITFESVRVRRTGMKSCTVVGNLTIHGIARTVSFNTDFTGYARDPMNDKWKLGMTAAGQIDRRTFHMQFNQVIDIGISLIDYETGIELRIEATQVEG
jgi:polyisoprenoid-binding protein YceI